MSDTIPAILCGGTGDGQHMNYHPSVEHHEYVQHDAEQSRFWMGVYHRTDERIGGRVVYTLDPRIEAGAPPPKSDGTLGRALMGEANLA